MIRFDFIVQIHTLKHVTVLQCKDTTVLKQKPLQLNNPRQYTTWRSLDWTSLRGCLSKDLPNAFFDIVWFK